MPWELLYPRAPHRDEGFLVQQLPVLRQVPDQHHPAMVRLEGAHCVVPPRSPSNAKHEADVVRRALGAAGVDGISDHDIESLDDLLLMLDSGTAGLLHFACHNGYSVEAGGSFIRMVGGNFVPALLNSIRTDGTLARKNPLIFLNACRSAGIAPYYTRIMGWAEQFMSAGAGAFIGTLWPVETNRAATFAEVFYTNLLAGQTLGNASLQARRTIEDPADPSWLAYTIYGNPNAVASLGH
jgi:CHAT domain-containing protein